MTFSLSFSNIGVKANSINSLLVNVSLLSIFVLISLIIFSLSNSLSEMIGNLNESQSLMLYSAIFDFSLVETTKKIILSFLSLFL